jgi:hypothetical protein
LWRNHGAEAVLGHGRARLKALVIQWRNLPWDFTERNVDDPVKGVRRATGAEVQEQVVPPGRRRDEVAFGMKAVVPVPANADLDEGFPVRSKLEVRDEDSRLGQQTVETLKSGPASAAGGRRLGCTVPRQFSQPRKLRRGIGRVVPSSSRLPAKSTLENFIEPCGTPWPVRALRLRGTTPGRSGNSE